MKKSRLALVAAAIGSFSLVGATALTPIHQACAQQARVSFSEDIAPFSRDGACLVINQAAKATAQAGSI